MVPWKWYVCSARRCFALIVLLLAALVCVASGPCAVRSGAGEVDELAVYAETDVDKAVDKALDFLAKTQAPQGCWDTQGFGRSTAVTSLAVMAFLARGHVPGRGKYGKCLERAVAYLLQSQKPDGYLVQASGYNSMYDHGAATLCLAEVLGMVVPQPPQGGTKEPDPKAAKKDPAKEAAQKGADAQQFLALKDLDARFAKAVELTLRSQGVNKDPNSAGGWRYNPPAGDSDISCTGWQLMSLRAARNDGYPVPKTAIEKGVGYILKCHTRDGGFSYQPGSEAGLARTGTGMVSLLVCGEYKREQLKTAADWLLKHPPDWEGQAAWCYYYGIYYATQACFQCGDKYWDFWKPALHKVLLPKQKPDGSWPYPPGDSVEAGAGPTYSTAMGVLALSVEYHYLPIYQR